MKIVISLTKNLLNYLKRRLCINVRKKWANRYTCTYACYRHLFYNHNCLSFLIEIDDSVENRLYQSSELVERYNAQRVFANEAVSSSIINAEERYAGW